MPHIPGLRPILCGALLLSAPAGAYSQTGDLLADPPGWVGEAAGAGINALLGGLTAGLTQHARGGSFQDGFTRGALGGAAVYAGKRIAVERFPAAGLLGREVAAVGSSVVRNAAEARPSLERLVLPVGPVRLYLDTGSRRRLRARVDLATLLAAGYAVLTPELEWDAAASFSGGAPVFRVENRLLRGPGEDPDSPGAGSGITRAGTIYLSRLPGLDYDEDFAHERVHVIQNDLFFLSWTDPVEEWALARLPGGERVGRVVDLNLSPLVVRGLSLPFRRYENRPWELEAEFLARRP